MRRSSRFLLALCAVALGVLTFGLALPVTREGGAEALIAAPPEEVIRVILDVAAQPEWRSGIGRIETTAAGWREVTARGETIDFVLVEETPARVALTVRSDRGWTGEWEAVLSPEDGGTRIAVTERPTIPNPFFRIFARLMFDPAAFASSYLTELKARVEGV